LNLSTVTQVYTNKDKIKVELSLLQSDQSRFRIKNNRKFSFGFITLLSRKSNSCGKILPNSSQTVGGFSVDNTDEL